MFLRDRVQVINGFEITENFLLLCFFLFLFLALYNPFHLHLFHHDAVEPIDTGHVGAKIQLQRRIGAQQSRDIDRMLIVNQK